MAEITGMRTGMDSQPMTAQDEQRHHLEQRLTEARERLMHGRGEVAMFEASCVAGLQALDKAVGAKSAQSIVHASDPADAHF